MKQEPSDPNTVVENASQADVALIQEKLGSMNRGPVQKLWEDVRAFWALATDPTAAWSSKAIAIGALVYLVSPLDAIPDLVPILGLTDDAAVIVGAVSALCYELTKYR